MTVPISDLEKRPSVLPEELRTSTGFLLARVGMALKTQAIDAFEELGFSMYQYSVLAILKEGACSTQGTIADVLAVDRSQLVGVLDDLEARGLVERRRDPNDRRRHTVSLTPEGKRQVVKLRGVAKKIEDRFLAPLDDAERRALHDGLLRVATNWNSRFGPCP